MNIAGLQKLTLIDYPGKLACTIFLFGCNFRCGFCHNPELVLPEKSKIIFSEQEILDFLNKRKKYLDGVCITGGEPLINQGLPEFLKKIKELGYLLKVDTNGSNPELLKKLIDEKLVDYIAMDIKASKDNYDIVAGVGVDLKKIEESIKLVASFENSEFRTTVIPVGRDKNENIIWMETSEIIRIVKWIKELNDKCDFKYYLQKFVPRENKLIDKKFEQFSETPEELMKEMEEAVKEFQISCEIR